MASWMNMFVYCTISPRVVSVRSKCLCVTHSKCVVLAHPYTFYLVENRKLILWHWKSHFAKHSVPRWLCLKFYGFCCLRGKFMVDAAQNIPEIRMLDEYGDRAHRKRSNPPNHTLGYRISRTFGRLITIILSCHSISLNSIYFNVVRGH